MIDKGCAQEDPKGLVFEAYRIEGITEGECRTIFLDWALSLPVELDNRTGIEGLLSRYGDAYPDHPMTRVLQDGLVQIGTPKRRGGWRSRARS